ncbi:MAG: WHG domain-containing protein [Chloroflexota bacterium]|nr:WHG domain-containing protein [Chloroflexota bacterium]
MPRVGLDRAAVIAAAAIIADTEGIEQVTVARLAARLGIRPPSLYNHIAGNDDVRHELALLGVRQLTATLMRVAVGKAGDDAVYAFADAYRAYARQHPGVYAAALLEAPEPGDRPMEEASTELVAIVVAILAPYGLAEDAALHAVRGLRSALHGFVSLEAIGGFGLPLDLDESFHLLVRALIAGMRQLRDTRMQ